MKLQLSLVEFTYSTVLYISIPGATFPDAEKVLDSVVTDIRILPKNIYSHFSGFILGKRDSLYNKTRTPLNTLEDVLHISREALEFSTGRVKILIDYSVVGDKISYFRDVSSNIPIKSHTLLGINILEPTGVVLPQADLASKEDVYVTIENSLKGILQICPLSRAIQHGWKIGERNVNPKHLHNISADSTYYTKMYDKPLIEAGGLALTGLYKNISKSIQYNHFRIGNHPKFLAYINALSYATVREYEELDSEYKSPKRARLVPKNGEKFAGNREMLFRTNLANGMMATAVTTLYNTLIIPKGVSGSVVNGGVLIPYIYTYSLFQEDVARNSDDYKFCTYLDIHAFFSNVTYPLVRDAVKWATLVAQEETVTRCLNLIELSFSEIPHLTIDSNYEHALSTIVMAYLTHNQLAVAVSSFVDDVAIFSESKKELMEFENLFIGRLSRYGLSLNHDKTKRFSGALKQLVILPTAFRYSIDDAEMVETLTEVKQIGFADYLKYHSKPAINAESSLGAFREHFNYREAEWVVKNYPRVIGKFRGQRYPVANEDNVLELLQYYTIKLEELTRDDIVNLLIIMQQFPSKQKWIMSLLKEFPTITAMYKNAASEYLRYLATGKLEHGKKAPYDASVQEIIVANVEALTLATDILSEHGYSCISVSLPGISVSGTNALKGIPPGILRKQKDLVIKYLPEDKMYFINSKTIDIPYQLEHWIWMVENNSRIYEAPLI